MQFDDYFSLLSTVQDAWRGHYDLQEFQRSLQYYHQALLLTDKQPNPASRQRIEQQKTVTIDGITIDLHDNKQPGDSRKTINYILHISQLLHLDELDTVRLIHTAAKTVGGQGRLLIHTSLSTLIHNTLIPLYFNRQYNLLIALHDLTLIYQEQQHHFPQSLVDVVNKVMQQLIDEGLIDNILQHIHRLASIQSNIQQTDSGIGTTRGGPVSSSGSRAAAADPLYNTEQVKKPKEQELFHYLHVLLILMTKHPVSIQHITKLLTLLQSLSAQLLQPITDERQQRQYTVLTFTCYYLVTMFAACLELQFVLLQTSANQPNWDVVSATSSSPQVNLSQLYTAMNITGADHQWQHDTYAALFLLLWSLFLNKVKPLYPNMNLNAATITDMTLKALSPDIAIFHALHQQYFSTSALLHSDTRREHVCQIWGDVFNDLILYQARELSLLRDTDQETELACKRQGVDVTTQVFNFHALLYCMAAVCRGCVDNIQMFWSNVEFQEFILADLSDVSPASTSTTSHSSAAASLSAHSPASLLESPVLFAYISLLCALAQSAEGSGATAATTAEAEQVDLIQNNISRDQQQQQQVQVLEHSGAVRVYWLIKTCDRLNWDWICSIFQQVIHLYSPQRHPASLPSTGGYSHHPPYHHHLGSTRHTVSATPTIPLRESALLCGLLQLATAVLSSPDVQLTMYATPEYKLLDRLCSLLGCRVELHMKAAIFNCLSALAKGQTEIAEQVWERIERAQILPTQNYYASTTATHPHTTTTTTTTALEGIYYDLEEVETIQRVYPVTLAFSRLILTLLYSTTTPRSTTLTVLPYINFFTTRVFLSLSDREYQHKAERWALTESCLAIMVKCVMEDEEAAATTTPTTATTQTADAAALSSPSPGHLLIRELLSGKELFVKLLETISRAYQLIEQQQEESSTLVTPADQVTITTASGLIQTSRQQQQYLPQHQSQQALAAQQQLQPAEQQPSTQLESELPYFDLSNDDDPLSSVEGSLCFALQLLSLVMQREESLISSIRQSNVRAKVYLLSSLLFAHPQEVIVIAHATAYIHAFHPAYPLQLTQQVAQAARKERERNRKLLLQQQQQQQQQQEQQQQEQQQQQQSSSVNVDMSAEPEHDLSVDHTSREQAIQVTAAGVVDDSEDDRTGLTAYYAASLLYHLTAVDDVRLAHLLEASHTSADVARAVAAQIRSAHVGSKGVILSETDDELQQPDAEEEDLGSEQSKGAQARLLLIRLLLYSIDHSGAQSSALNTAHVLLGFITNGEIQPTSLLNSQERFALNAIIDVVQKPSLYSQWTAVAFQTFLQRQDHFFLSALESSPLLLHHRDALVFLQQRRWLMQSIALQLFTATQKGRTESRQTERTLSLLGLISTEVDAEELSQTRSQNISAQPDAGALIPYSSSSSVTARPMIVTLLDACHISLPSSSSAVPQYINGISTLTAKQHSPERGHHYNLDKLRSLLIDEAHLTAEQVEQHLQQARTWNKISQRLSTVVDTVNAWKNLVQMTVLCILQSSQLPCRRYLTRFTNLLQQVLSKLSLEDPVWVAMADSLSDVTLLLMQKWREQQQQHLYQGAASTHEATVFSSHHLIHSTLSETLVLAIINHLHQRQQQTRANLYATLLIYLESIMSLSAFSSTIRTTSSSSTTILTMIERHLSLLLGQDGRLMDALCTDAANGQYRLRSLAFAVLQTMIDMEAKLSTALTSFTHSHCLDYIQQHNLLLTCLSQIHQADDQLRLSILSSRAQYYEPLLQYVAIMTFLLSLALQEEGRVQLLHSGVLRIVNQMKCWDVRVREDRTTTSTTAADAIASHPSTQQRYYALLLPLFQLFTALLSSTVPNTQLQQSVLTFFDQHEPLIKSILQERGGAQHAVNIAALELVRTVVGVMERLQSKEEQLPAVSAHTASSQATHRPPLTILQTQNTEQAQNAQTTTGTFTGMMKGLLQYAGVIQNTPTRNQTSTSNTAATPTTSNTGRNHLNNNGVISVPEHEAARLSVSSILRRYQPALLSLLDCYARPDAHPWLANALNQNNNNDAMQDGEAPVASASSTSDISADAATQILHVVDESCRSIINIFVQQQQQQQRTAATTTTADKASNISTYAYANPLSRKKHKKRMIFSSQLALVTSSSAREQLSSHRGIGIENEEAEQPTTDLSVLLALIQRILYQYQSIQQQLLQLPQVLLLLQQQQQPQQEQQPPSVQELLSLLNQPALTTAVLHDSVATHTEEEKLMMIDQYVQQQQFHYKEQQQMYWFVLEQCVWLLYEHVGYYLSGSHMLTSAAVFRGNAEQWVLPVLTEMESVLQLAGSSAGATAASNGVSVSGSSQLIPVQQPVEAGSRSQQQQHLFMQILIGKLRREIIQ